MKRVIGIGGIFFKAKDKNLLCDWYKKHLGIPVEDWGGAVFKWTDIATLNKEAFTVWSPFKDDTSYFNPSEKSFMLNFVVDDLAPLITLLKSEGIEFIGEAIEEENGKFAWILDPEGNKIELWEPLKS